MKLRIAAIFAAALLVATTPAFAQVEQIDQAEPDGGEWQAEWFGTFGDANEQVVELFYGITDALALGVEAEFEGPRGGLMLEGIEGVALYRFADPETDPVGAAIGVQLGIARDGSFSGAEARAIADHRGAHWWLQGNLILRHAREDGESGTGLAYAVSAQRAVAEDLWFGAEASGRFARLSGDAGLAPAREHFIGASLTLGRPLGNESEIEIGAAWLFRLAGPVPASVPRVFVQIGF